MKKTSRVNARLTDAAASKLVEIVKRTGSNMSDVIVKAIEAYYQQAVRDDTNCLAILQGSGFIGCGSADASLSQDYKTLLSKSLKEKL
jgi:hypothetical protein